MRKRLFKLPGGRGPSASEYHGYREIILEQFAAESEIQASVCRVFDALEYLHSPKAKTKVLEERKNDTVPVTSVNGTHGFSYDWDASTLEKEGAAIVDRVIEVAKMMKPYYEELLDVYR